MARLHEYQGKALLKKHGVMVPRGEVVASPEQARQAAAKIGGRMVLKVQAWLTGRKAKGGVVFADDADAADVEARRLLAMTFGNFPVEQVLVEEVIDIAHELFVSITIDDAAQAPVMLIDLAGGSGIEERAQSVARLPIHLKQGVDQTSLQGLLRKSAIPAASHVAVIDAIAALVTIAKTHEARSLEINPLAVTAKGEVVAADCRMTIDDYAVFRHPELGIEIAREMDHPPTELERIAYTIEQADHRGTFYFAQLPIENAARGKGLIGFHGAGGGGSMMSMDAASTAGFTLANFCDTSGNPSAAKVYKAARIILSQPGLVGYFGSGSGVASQEQFHSAYGLAKAFIELKLDIPAVVRLGGNSEDRAVEILQASSKLTTAPIEGFKKDHTPAYCAERFAKLVEKNFERPWTPRPRNVPEFVEQSYSFPINGGRVWIDHVRCDADTTRFVVEHSAGLLKSENALPVLAVSEEEVASKDSELIALEIECRRAGTRVVFVDLPIEGIDDDATAGQEMSSR